MDTLISIVQVLFFVGTPGVVLFLCARSKVLNAISPVVLCYLLGIFFGNIAGLDTYGVDPDAVMGPGELAPAEKLTETIAGLGVILALSLLLLSTDFVRWLRLAPVTILSAFLAMVSVVIVAGGSALAFKSWSDELPDVAGMLVGVYTGGTVNLAAVAKAMNVDAVTWGVVHTSDVIVTGLWFLVLLAVGGRVLAWVLPPFKKAEDGPDEAHEGSDVNEIGQAKGEPITAKDVLISLGAALMVAAIPLAIIVLAPDVVKVLPESWKWVEENATSIAILTATTIAIALSFVGPLRRLKGLYETGDYLLLVFCVAVGSLATLTRLAGAEVFLIAYTTFVVLVSVGLHVALSALFRIDRDTTIITSVAALYGPPFVPPVARALKNREIIVSGVTTGLVGLAVGNYLGIGVAYAVRWLGQYV